MANKNDACFYGLSWDGICGAEDDCTDCQYFRPNPTCDTCAKEWSRNMNVWNCPGTPPADRRCAHYTERGCNTCIHHSRDDEYNGPWCEREAQGYECEWTSRDKARYEQTPRQLELL